MPADTRVLVIDPDQLSRHGLCTILEERGFEVVSAVQSVCDLPEGSALDGAAAVALVDRSVLGESVEDGLASVHEAMPNVHVIALGDALDVNVVIGCYRADAAGFVLKSVDADVLVAAIRMVLHGERVYPSELIAEFLRGRVSATGHLDARCCDELGLSEREQQILKSLVRGDSNKVIANTLSITEATVKAHLQALMRKINADNRTQLAVWAVNKLQT
jgi:two-component system nitrate/nitrite response regulator NarL